MDKSCQSSEPSATTSSAVAGPAGSTGQFLRQLNKSSHKISKPVSSLRKPFDPSPPPPESTPPPPTDNPNPNPNQPPVYNISKADFRDVVQKLTGSPAHERISTPSPPSPPVHATPKPPSSRLQRIRPPPLVQIANRPPPLLVGIHPNIAGGFSGGNGFPLGGFRPPPPLSPLPPLPSCHAAAESPISAYMRFLHTSIDSADPRRNPAIPQPLISPKYPNPTAMNPLAQNQPPPPSSPLPFGCFPSPKSPCPLLSSNVLFSPTGMGQLGFSQVPVSPTVPPVSSPRWRNV